MKPTFIFEHLADIEIITRRRQKNLRMRIKDNTVVVSAPKFCSQTQIQNFIKSNEKWVMKTLEKQMEHQQKLASTLKDRQHDILLRGKWIPLRFAGNHSRSEGVIFTETDDAICYKTGYESGSVFDAEVLKQLANHWLKDQAGIEIRERLLHVAANLPFTWNKVFVRSQKTKWGTCSSQKNLSFNWRIIKTPYFIWDYLIVHELCHTVHMNHSKDFWNLVESIYPERKAAEKWLRENETIIFADSLIK